MAGAARQIAYRLKSEGKAEVVRDAREIGTALKDSYAAGEQGAAQASAAAERLEKRWKALAVAANDSAQAQQMQARYNAVLGVSAGPGQSARDSAEFFRELAEAEDAAEAKARALKAALDPVTAAQDRLNEELREYQALAAAGRISTDELAEAQNRARQRFAETNAQIDRNGRGLTRLAAASRLNLLRQAADVAVTLPTMNPAMVALQQGPQIADAFATSNIRLSRSLLLVGGALTATAGAAAVLSVAYLDGEKTAIAYDKAVSSLGRTQGLTAVQLRELTVAAAEQGEVSISSAQQQAAAYLATGRIGGEMIGKLIAISRDYASFMGVDMEDATKSLAKAMLEPDKAARTLTETTGLLTLEQLRNIESLVEQGKLLEAQRLLYEALNGTVSGHANKIGEITSAWDAAKRAVSDYFKKLGEDLYTTKSERLQSLINERAETERYMAGGRGLTRGQQRVYDERGREASRLQAELTAERQRDQQRSASAAANQAAYAADEVRKRREKEGERAQRAAEAAARRERAAAAREQREAEQKAREQLQRDRQEEDVLARRQVEIAQLRGDVDEVRRLEDANAVRARTRQLIDAEVAAEEAKTRALDEQRQIIEARTTMTLREREELQDNQSYERDRLLGLNSLLVEHDRHIALLERINAYTAKGVDYYQAWGIAAAELKDMEEARAEVAQRARDGAERDWKIALAIARGGGAPLRDLQREEWIEQRAREIEGRGDRFGTPLDYGAGKDQASKDYGELMRAQTTGAMRDGLRSFVDAIRRGDIREALASQFEKATDRLLDKLFDAFSSIDFSGGKGGSAGSWLTKGLQAFFGKNADGTDYWRGGPTWVGERGPEILNLPRGAQVIEHQRSLRMLSAGASAAPVINMPVKVINNGSEPMTATTRQTSDGLEVLLAPAVRGEIQKMGADGSLARAQRLTPRGKTR